MCDDGLGVLTDAFNGMLEQIQAQDSALLGAQAKLQEQGNALQREIVERERAEAAHARLAAILEATPDVVMSTQPNGAALYLNQAGRKLLGVTDEKDLAGRQTIDFHPPWAREIIAQQALPAAVQNGSWAGETALLNHVCEVLHVSQVLIAHKKPKGGIE